MLAMEEADQLQRELAKRHLLDCICWADPTYDPGDHHILIAGVLERVEADVWAIKSGQKLDHEPLNRVMITLPPRHGKSRETSIEFPAWVLGRHPDLNVMVTSYAADLAEDFSRLSRSRLADIGPLWGVKVSRESASVSKWGIARHPYGGMIAAGVGGPITGKGAHIAIIDDPHKNWQEAASKTMRDTVWDWYKSTLRTRLAPGAAIIVIETRWHEDDLVGRLLKQQKEQEKAVIERYMTECDNDTELARTLAMADEEWELIERWTIINIPALCEDKATDPLGREMGEAIWPKMYSRKYLLQTAKVLGSYLWNALYQQRPSPEGGSVFKRQHFRYFDLSEGLFALHHDDSVERFSLDQCFCFQTCDPAASEKKQADYFVLSTWYVTPKADLLLYDVQRMRLETPSQPNLFKQAYMRFHPVAQGIPPAGLGINLYQSLRNSGLPVVELKEEADKVTRAIPMSARYEAGKVFHLSGALWLGEWEEELISFPKGANDDQVDTASTAAVMLAEIINSTQNSGTIVHEESVSISPV